MESGLDLESATRYRPPYLISAFITQERESSKFSFFQKIDKTRIVLNNAIQTTRLVFHVLFRLMGQGMQSRHLLLLLLPMYIIICRFNVQSLTARDSLIGERIDSICARSDVLKKWIDEIAVDETRGLCITEATEQFAVAFACVCIVFLTKEKHVQLNEMNYITVYQKLALARSE